MFTLLSFLFVAMDSELSKQACGFVIKYEEIKLNMKLKYVFIKFDSFDNPLFDRASTAIIRTSAGLLLIGPLGAHVN